METLINLNNLSEFKDLMDALVDDKVDDKYTKPNAGIPETDLTNDIQNKLDRVDHIVWMGTQAEYDEQKTSIPDDTLVIITDGEQAVFDKIPIQKIYDLFKEEP